MKEKKFTELLKEFMESLLPGIPEDEVCLQCSYSIDADGNSYLYKKCAMCIAKENEVVRLCPKCNGGGTVPGPYFGVMCPCAIEIISV